MGVETDTWQAIEDVSYEIELALESGLKRYRRGLSKHKVTGKRQLRNEKRQAVLKAKRRRKPVAA